MTENEIHAIICDTMHKRHNQMLVEGHKDKPCTWNKLPDFVREEIDLQAAAIFQALLPYLD